MADSDSTVLGKRERGDAVSDANEDGDDGPQPSTTNGGAAHDANMDDDNDDDNDDDVGPMPMPEDGSGHGSAARKKRKGALHLLNPPFFSSLIILDDQFSRMKSCTSPISPVPIAILNPSCIAMSSTLLL